MDPQKTIRLKGEITETQKGGLRQQGWRSVRTLLIAIKTKRLAKPSRNPMS
jgi:hypothetical protein